jgi:hypothetical protein
MDHKGPGGVVGRGVAPALDGDGAVAGVVIRSVHFMRAAMFGRGFRIVRLIGDQGQIVMRGGIFRVKPQHLLEPGAGAGGNLPSPLGTAA